MNTARRPDGRTVSAIMQALSVVLFPVVALAQDSSRPSDRLTVRPSDSAAARLTDPRLVPNRERTTSRDDAAIVQALEHKIKCTCGCGLDVFTCRTTDFTCATSPAMHRAVLARLDSSMTAEQVLAAFESQYGQSILMQPPKRGFNWAAYLMPFAALAGGLTLLLVTMKRWTRGTGGSGDRGIEKTANGLVDPPIPRSPDPTDLERLARELEHFEA